MSREIMQQALDALEFPHDSEWSNKAKAIEALQHALAQPEQEELIQFKDDKWSYVRKPWQGLTDDEIALYSNWLSKNVIKAIEAKLKEKNT